MMVGAESRIAYEAPAVGVIARSTLTVIRVVLSVVGLTLAPMTTWARNLVLDTNGYLSTMAPLGASSQMQDAVGRAVEKQADEHLDVNTYIAPALLLAGIS